MRREVLDHGYISLVESWGSDEQIIEAARMSTSKGFLGWGPKPDGNPGDERLLRFLYEHKHFTPFEMAGLTVEVQAPIFIFREWHRHRTQSYNELSARYTPLPDVNYIPDLERLLMNETAGNKQATTLSGSKSLNPVAAQKFRQKLETHYRNVEELYKEALTTGIPKEIARIHLPVGRYSKMRASANLRNWLAFLTLRMDEAAQWEIRQYANALADMVRDLFPRTYQLFVESRS